MTVHQIKLVSRRLAVACLLTLLFWAGTGGAAQAYTSEELNTLCGPIALYPDPLLSNILSACTYPQEVAQAAAWVNQNGTIGAGQVNTTLANTGWDPSVKALVVFPDVLNYLNDNMAWTQSMGNAFLTQQTDVFYAIQSLRRAAQASGALVNTPQELVSTDNGNVVIQSTNPDYISVPIYDPSTVYYASPRFYSGNEMSPMNFALGVLVGRYLYMGVPNWQNQQMYFGQGYNYYYPDEYPNNGYYNNYPNYPGVFPNLGYYNNYPVGQFPTYGNQPLVTNNYYYNQVQTAWHHNTGNWQFNRTHRRGLAVPTTPLSLTNGRLPLPTTPIRPRFNPIQPATYNRPPASGVHPTYTPKLTATPPVINTRPAPAPRPTSNAPLKPTTPPVINTRPPAPAPRPTSNAPLKPTTPPVINTRPPAPAPRPTSNAPLKPTTPPVISPRPPAPQNSHTMPNPRQPAPQQYNPQTVPAPQQNRPQQPAPQQYHPQQQPAPQQNRPQQAPPEKSHPQPAPQGNHPTASPTHNQ